ncbi:MAG: diguanylate cyclase [Sideroxyarcus sp.]|nr:diguanylate cyclase [Sideroxyarcus sp.]
MTDQVDVQQLRQSAERNLASDGFMAATRRLTTSRRVIPTRRLAAMRREAVACPLAEARNVNATRRLIETRRVSETRRVEKLTPADALLHELQVHQIELEMQNENLRQSLLELEKSRDRYIDFYDFAPVGYLTLDAYGVISEINLTGASLLGVERNTLLSQCLTPYVTAEYDERWRKHFINMLTHDEKQVCELALQRKGGPRFFAQLDCLRLNKTGEPPLLRIVLTDISERIKNEEKIRQLAFYDALTQLPNRRLLSDRLDQAMAASKRSGHYVALMFLDLDNFKPLNDSHGHDMGDLLLVEAAHRITRCLREIDTVARFGGDEFVVLLSELNAERAESAAEAGIVAEKIRTVLAEVYQLSPQHEVELVHHCTSSIGVVLFIDHEDRPDDILKKADKAMYQAKTGGGNRIHFFKPDE